MTTRRTLSFVLRAVSGLAMSGCIASAWAQAAIGLPDSTFVTGASVSVEQNVVSNVTLLNEQQLDELLGPIALYPDPLLAQILPASTYPLEVVQASRYVAEHPDLAGLDDQGWEPSVLAVGHFPSVIAMMNEKLDWTIRLGQAFMAQPGDVMGSIQRLRVLASAAGALASTPEQQVFVSDGYVQIIPAYQELIYVPVYEPSVVYVRPSWGYYTSSCLSFGSGFTFGWWLDLDCDWRQHHVYYRHWRDRHCDEWRWNRIDRHRDSRHDGRGERDWHDGRRHESQGQHGTRHPDEHGWREGEAWKRDMKRERPHGDKARLVPQAPTLGVDSPTRDDRVWQARPRNATPNANHGGKQLPEPPRTRGSDRKTQQDVPPSQGVRAAERPRVKDAGVQPPRQQLPQATPPKAEPRGREMMRDSHREIPVQKPRSDSMSREGDGSRGIVRQAAPKSMTTDAPSRTRDAAPRPSAPAPRSAPSAAPKSQAPPSAPPRQQAAPTKPAEDSKTPGGNSGGGMQRGMGGKRSRD